MGLRVFDASTLRAIGATTLRAFGATPLDRQGVERAARYPSFSLHTPYAEHLAPDLAAALARAYNRWIGDFCRQADRRLLTLALHEERGGRSPFAGDRFDTWYASHVVSHPFEMMLALTSLIVEGVFDRHPRLASVCSKRAPDG